MSATNHTANYELSQYIGSDEPKYLTDYNGDMSKIDTAIKTVETSATTANTGVATNASAISALDTAVGSLQTQVTTVAGVANGNTGSINTINSLIGSGEPTTTDKTLIGAINELYDDIHGQGDPITADDVAFDKTGTSLQATNVQDAIVEIATASPASVSADDVSYDGTTSGLSATNVQDAIDEVVAEIPSAGIVDLNLVNNVTPTITAAGGSVMANYTKVHVLTNADASIGKIYGGVAITGASIAINDWTTVATLSVTGLPTISTAYDIEIGFCTATIGGTANSLLTRLHFNTDGTVAIQMFLGAAGTLSTATISLAPCLYILKNLGD